MRKRTGEFDRVLLVLVLTAVIFGLVILYSASAYNGRVRFADSGYYLKKQLSATALGLVLMCIASCMDYTRLEKAALPAYLLSLGLSVLVLVAGDSYNGSRRWLSVGPLSFQPAEFSKLAVILFLAFAVSRKKRPGDRLLPAVGTLFFVLPLAALVGINNLSTAVIILGIGVLMIFVTNPRYLPFLAVGGAGAALAGIFLSMEAYRLERLKIWLDPENYEKGFQTIQGLYAIGSGGLFGKGLGESIQKLGFVPEAQNDMIFSIVCEELGLAGALLVLLLFGLLIWRFFVIAVHAEDLFGALLAAGVMGHMALQVILNVAVVTNSIPNTGITLPFISYGGTSVLFLLTEMGVVLAVSRRQK